MLVVLPQQRHEQVHVEQEGHGVWLSISLTRPDVITPLVTRTTGRPSSPVATVKRAPPGCCFASRMSLCQFSFICLQPGRRPRFLCRWRCEVTSKSGASNQNAHEGNCEFHQIF